MGVRGTVATGLSPRRSLGARPSHSSVQWEFRISAPARGLNIGHTGPERRGRPRISGAARRDGARRPAQRRRCPRPGRGGREVRPGTSRKHAAASSPAGATQTVRCPSRGGPGHSPSWPPGPRPTTSGKKAPLRTGWPPPSPHPSGARLLARNGNAGRAATPPARSPPQPRLPTPAPTWGCMRKFREPWLPPVSGQSQVLPGLGVYTPDTCCTRPQLGCLASPEAKCSLGYTMASQASQPTHQPQNPLLCLSPET